MLIAIRGNKFGSCPISSIEVSMPLSLQPALSCFSDTFTPKSETKANCQYADNSDFAENFCSVPETLGHLRSLDLFSHFLYIIVQKFFSTFP